MTYIEAMSEIKPRVRISSIAAMAENNVIGKDGGMPWHLPEDLKHFKRTTIGKPILMGRKSYESLGKPLPGRANIVISRSYKDLPSNAPSEIHQGMEAVAHKVEPQNEDGPFLYASIEDGIEAAREMVEEQGLDDIFITGGGEIYKQTLPVIDRLYITLIHREYEGDTYFPEFDWEDWSIISEEKHDGSSDDGPAFTFFTLDRKKNS